MKKLIIAVILFIHIINAYGEGTRFGVFVDPQFSWLVPDVKNIDNDGARFNIKGGLIADFYFAENYAFTTGISISNAGGNLYYNDSLTLKVHNADEQIAPESTVNYKLQYLKFLFLTHKPSLSYPQVVNYPDLR